MSRSIEELFSNDNRPENELLVRLREEEYRVKPFRGLYYTGYLDGVRFAQQLVTERIEDEDGNA